MTPALHIEVPGGATKVLLHACCAPCSSAIVEWLMAHDIKPVIYYYNPNIYPFEEYEIRKNESKRHADSLGIEWIDDDWSHETWLHSICGLEHEPERGQRCVECFYHRLFATARKAQDLDIPFFATTLASSRWKNLEQINAAGLKAEEMVNRYPKDSIVHEPVHFWAQNWRKDGLQERRNELLHQYDFYNQTYCGCEFSMPDRRNGNGAEPADS
jgi:predicted adenine nucleotide alpha hydrolase (AANH) superfamily ATPase